MKKLKIEMVLDLNCSWCPIGYKHITDAIEELDLKSKVELQFLPFMINPDMPYEGQLINDFLKKATGNNDAQLSTYRANLVKVASASGVEIDFNKRTHYYNTLDGQILLQFAQKKSLQNEVYQLLAKAYYVNGLRANDLCVLSDVSDILNLKTSEVQNILEDKKFRQEVEDLERKTKELGIRSVPAFLFNDKTLISGTQSVDYFKNLLLNLFSN